MNALAPATITRLAKVCALFSSNHVGERAAAASRADEIVRGAGLTWFDLLGAKECHAGMTNRNNRRRLVLTPGEILARHGNQLTGWEKGFLTSILRQKKVDHAAA